jgi:hypothetical protein
MTGRSGSATVASRAAGEALTTRPSQVWARRPVRLAAAMTAVLALTAVAGPARPTVAADTPSPTPVHSVVPAGASGSPGSSTLPRPTRSPVAPFPVFRDTMSFGWSSLDALRSAIADPSRTGLETIAREGPGAAAALEAGLGSVLPDVCYLDAWRLEWLVAVGLRLVADLWSGGHELYARIAAERLASDLAAADEALATIGCD